MRFTLVLRAYDDGVAFKYSIGTLNNSIKSMMFFGGAETTAFTLPFDSIVTHLNADDDIHCNFEGRSRIDPVMSLTGLHTLPLLYQLPSHPNSWGLISEANLDGSYPGSVVYAENNILTLSFPHRQWVAITAQTPFTSPWRFIVTGKLANVVENTMPENLSPSAVGDFSWVEPGVSAWTWLVGLIKMQRNEKEIRHYIDLAAEMGWKYVILDEGWQPNALATGRYNGTYKYFPELVKYAASKGIGFIVWVYMTDFDRPDIRTARLDEWAELGIKGIKVDFFDREAQDRIRVYREIYEKAAQRRMLVVCHGANKPTGERRTWPNAVSREGVRGEEHNRNIGTQTTMLLFTRAVVGPTDFTPRLVPHENSDTSVAHQLALTVAFETGIPCMADTHANYRSSVAYPFLQHLPAQWNETKFIAGAPGKYYIVARRHGDVWYVGGVNGDNARTIPLRLSFLTDGRVYTAELYRDGIESKMTMKKQITIRRRKQTRTEEKTMYELMRETLEVARLTEVVVNMPRNGGFAMKLIPKESGDAKTHNNKHRTNTEEIKAETPHTHTHTHREDDL